MQIKTFLLLVTFYLYLDRCTAFKLLQTLEEIPNNERTDFIKYNLLKGYQLIREQQFVKNTKQELPSDAFSMEFFQLFIRNFKEARPRSDDCSLCFPSKGCINICDAGVHPFAKIPKTM